MAQCNFDIEILAPTGLEMAEPFIKECSLPLELYESGYNGKVIFRSGEVDWLEWNMDSSNSDKMFASGQIDLAPTLAETHLRTLSVCLIKAGLPHSILLDHPTGTLYAKIESDSEAFQKET